MSASFLVHVIALSNPLGALPVFVAQTSSFSASERRMAALLSGICISIITATFITFGKTLLDGFGITINDFRLAGALVLLLMGLKMMHGENSPVHHDGSETTQARPTKAQLLQTVMMPLAIPLIAGPGVLCAVVSASNSARYSYEELMWVSISLGVIITILFYFSEFILRFVGEKTLSLVARIMGLIILSIAMEMLVEGLKIAFPALS